MGWCASGRSRLGWVQQRDRSRATFSLLYTRSFVGVIASPPSFYVGQYVSSSPHTRRPWSPSHASPIDHSSGSSVGSTLCWTQKRRRAACSNTSRLQRQPIASSAAFASSSHDIFVDRAETSRAGLHSVAPTACLHEPLDSFPEVQPNLDTLPRVLHGRLFDRHRLCWTHRASTASPSTHRLTPQFTDQHPASVILSPYHLRLHQTALAVPLLLEG